VAAVPKNGIMRIKMTEIKRMRSPDPVTARSDATTVREGIYLHFVLVDVLGVRNEFLFRPVVDGKSEGRCNIGRSKNANNHVVVDDRQVSNIHFQVTWSNDGKFFGIADFNSRNGTFVEGEKVGTDKIDLQINQIVSFGRQNTMWLHQNPPASLCLAPAAIAKVKLVKRKSK
jgi:hypothetical protein